MYGIAYTGVSYVSNQGGRRVTAVTSGNLQTSRLCFPGNESWREGVLSAILNLETSVVMYTRTLPSASRLWNRQSRVDVNSTTSGRITMGLHNIDLLLFYPIQQPEVFRCCMGRHQRQCRRRSHRPFQQHDRRHTYFKRHQMPLTEANE